jgi:large subunit ribosomal protein L23
MEFTRIIIRPIHTEKTYTFQSQVNKKYAFEVDSNATKHDIALAFESIYGIKPTKVATQIRKPAKIRTGTAKPGFSKLMKIAYITLPVGADIAASNNEAATDTKATTKKTETKKDVVKKEVTKSEVTESKKAEVTKTKAEHSEDTKAKHTKKTAAVKTHKVEKKDEAATAHVKGEKE